MTISVVRAGAQTTVQDWPGRIGYWKVGVPPSGPMDDLSFRLANLAVGNAESATGLEATLTGPTLRFEEASVVAVTGAPVLVTVNGRVAPQWAPITVAAGDVLDVGAVGSIGLRVYIAVAGGIEAEEYLGSAATFTLGRFGGHHGRALRDGDELTSAGLESSTPPRRILFDEQPALTNHWRLAVTIGPHGAPEFFTPEDIDDLLGTDYEVHFNSDRTGVRLVGPQPRWARSDGGEAGLHPSNIHDNAYSVGALDFTGDTPILLGPDGPSLGGFVCPVTLVTAERWKLGQLKPGDTVRFVPVRTAESASLSQVGLGRRASVAHVLSTGGDDDNGVLHIGDTADGTKVTYRRSGDDNILVEYGEQTLDLTLRARVHALAERIAAEAPRGLIDLTPGIRSLQVKGDPDVWTQRSMLDWLVECEAQLPAADDLVVPSRTVELPLSWDDPSTREAIKRYMLGVRSDAPWCPWNIELIRRMNGLDSVDDVYRTVFDASYLVLGLGDVYLGAPVAVPLDPRHRLVTTKYNPARTWTPENAVGIGGAYLCVYGMEGPGGYQFVGRTTQVWNHRHPLPTPGFDPEHPWLLRFFDKIRWYPVGAEELLDMRADVAAGRGESIRIVDGSFSLAEHQRFLDANAADIAAKRAVMVQAREEERRRWSERGEFGIKEGASS